MLTYDWLTKCPPPKKRGDLVSLVDKMGPTNEEGALIPRGSGIHMKVKQGAPDTLTKKKHPSSLITVNLNQAFHWASHMWVPICHFVHGPKHQARHMV